MDSPNLDRALRFKSNARRGGMIENIFMRDVTVGRVSEAVLTIDFLYDTGAAGDYRPVLRNVSLDHVESTSSPRVLWIVGFPGVTIENVNFSNCTFRGVDTAEVMNHAGAISFKNVTIEPANKNRSSNSPQATPQ
jgi:unsaturated rhamnogalacturonyl hydrolase